jgi:hypothetical protein
MAYHRIPKYFDAGVRTASTVFCYLHLYRAHYHLKYLHYHCNCFIKDFILLHSYMKNGGEFILKSLPTNHTSRCNWSLNIHYYTAVNY